MRKNMDINLINRIVTPVFPKVHGNAKNNDCANAVPDDKFPCVLLPTTCMSLSQSKFSADMLIGNEFCL